MLCPAVAYIPDITLQKITNCRFFAAVAHWKASNCTRASLHPLESVPDATIYDQKQSKGLLLIPSYYRKQ